MYIRGEGGGLDGCGGGYSTVKQPQAHFGFVICLLFTGVVTASG